MGVLALVLFQSLSMALFTIFSRPLAVRLTRAQFQVTAVFFTGLYFLSLPVAFLASDVYLSDFTEWWPLLVLASVAYGLQNVTLFWTLRYMDAAISSLMGMLGIIGVVVMATIILGEGLTWQQLGGAALIVGSIGYVLSAKVNEGERRHWTTGLILSLVTAVLLGIGATGEKYLLGQVELGSYIVWGWGLQWAVIFGTSLVYQPGLYKNVLRRANAKLLSAATVARTLSALSFVTMMLVLDNLSKVAVLSGLKVIFVAILGVLILHERQFVRRKIMAAVAAAIGVAIMFW